MWCDARRWAPICLLAPLLATTACKDEQPVRVQSLDLKGVSVVDEAELRAVLVTRAGSWIPFTKKPAFDTDEFQKDLQRLRAFYAERGYPDARVTDVDVRVRPEEGKRAARRSPCGKVSRCASVRCASRASTRRSPSGAGRR